MCFWGLGFPWLRLTACAVLLVEPRVRRVVGADHHPDLARHERRALPELERDGRAVKLGLALAVAVQRSERLADRPVDPVFACNAKEEGAGGSARTGHGEPTAATLTPSSTGTGAAVARESQQSGTATD